VEVVEEILVALLALVALLLVRPAGVLHLLRQTQVVVRVEHLVDLLATVVPASS
jgi:hypothetical protein